MQQGFESKQDEKRAYIYLVVRCKSKAMVNVLDIYHLCLIHSTDEKG